MPGESNIIDEKSDTNGTDLKDLVNQFQEVRSRLSQCEKENKLLREEIKQLKENKYAPNTPTGSKRSHHRSPSRSRRRSPSRSRHHSPARVRRRSPSRHRSRSRGDGSR
eukprot:762849_1